MEYVFTALNHQGVQIQDRLQAQSEEEALLRLHSQEFVVLSLAAEGRQAEARASLPKFSFGRKRAKLEQVVMLTRQLAIMMETGISIVDALETLHEHTENPELRDTLAAMRNDLAAGKTISQALRPHTRVFTELYVDMARTAETGGSLTDTLNQAATYLENALEMRRKVSGAMTYPMVVLGVAGLVILFLFIYLLPLFGEMFGRMQAEVPPLTRACLALSAVMKANWWAIPLLPIAGRIGWGLARKRPAVQLALARFILRVPILGDTVTKIVVARMLRALGTLLGAGVPLLSALDTTAQISGNPAFERAMTQVRSAVEQGPALSASLLQTRVFPAMVCQMISVGEKSGKLSEVLLRVASFYDREVDARLKALTSILEPVLIVVLGVIVGTVAAAVILPIYSLIGSVK